MNFKTTGFLFAFLALLLLIFGIAQLTGNLSPKDTSAYALPSLNSRKEPIKTEDIERVEIVRTKPTEEKLVFYRGENGWMSKEPNVRLEGHQVDRLIDQVKNARRDDKVELSNNLAQWELDAPRTIVTLTQKGTGKEFKLSLGGESPGGNDAMVYATSTDRKKPMAIKRRDLDTISKSLGDFRSKDLLGASALNTSSVTLQETGKDPVTLEKTADSKWKFVKPAYGDADYEGDTAALNAPDKPEKKGPTGVRELLDALNGVKVGLNGDFVADAVTSSDLASKYGLETGKPEKLRVEVKRDAGGLLGSGDDKKKQITEILLIGKRADDKEGDKYYARLENEPVVVKVSAKGVEPLLKAAEDPQLLRNRDLVQLDVARTDAIDIKNSTGLLKLRKSGEPNQWKLFAGGDKARGADDNAVQDLMNALTVKRQVKDFPSASRPDAELGLDKPTAEISAWVDAIVKDEPKKEEPKKDEPKKEEPKKDGDKKEPEKKDEKKEEPKKEEAKKDPDAEPKLKSDKPKVRLVFGKREGEVVYVRREEGETQTRLAVPATLLDKINAGPLAYLDRTLPTFPPTADVTKVVLVRDGQTYELDKEKKDDKAPPVWKFKQPKELADRTADAKTVDDLIADLRQLNADKLLVEKPTDGELEKYGLKPPSLQATVTIKSGDKTEDKVYRFGKLSEDKSVRYAQQSDRPVVFQIRPTSIVALQNELLDPTVLKLDVAKVQSIKLQGWEKKYDFTLHLNFERKSDKTWDIKEGPRNFQIDDKKLEAFLTELSNLRAERFVVYKSGAKPEHQLDKKTRTLEIEVMLEGEKTPVVLTLGAIDPKEKKSIYAQSSTAPGDVFLLPLTKFQKLLDEGAKFFTKDSVAAGS